MKVWLCTNRACLTVWGADCRTCSDCGDHTITRTVRTLHPEVAEKARVRARLKQTVEDGLDVAMQAVVDRLTTICEQETAAAVLAWEKRRRGDRS